MTSTPALVTASGFHHVRLTVTDMARTKAFYTQLFGAPPAMDFTGETDTGVHEDPERLYGGCVFQFAENTILGMRPVAQAGDTFDSTRVGLDHVSLSVSSLDELKATAQRLSDAGVEHGEIIELDDFGLAILSIQDPDDINLELSAPLS